MEVTVNNETLALEEGSNLSQLLESTSLTNKSGIAIAVNNAIIAYDQWNNKILKENDQIIIITATQGG